jgi:hypothetical protein
MNQDTLIDWTLIVLASLTAAGPFGALWYLIMHL